MWETGSGKNVLTEKLPMNRNYFALEVLSKIEIKYRFGSDCRDVGRNQDGKFCFAKMGNRFK